MDQPRKKPDAGDAASPAGVRKPKRRWRVPVLVFFGVLLLALILHRCYNPPETPNLPPLGGSGPAAQSDTAATVTPALPQADTTGTRASRNEKRPRLAPPSTPAPKSRAHDTSLSKTDTAKPAPATASSDSGRPYVYADPWGGRHFDSVTVTLRCRENCLILYSFEDSVHFKSYEQPFTFRRNTTLWISGLDSLNRQVDPIRIDYVIARNPGFCADGAMPVDMPGTGGKPATVCMDVYEWPDREGETPRAFATWKQAADSCRGAGKRLCTLDEWQTACRGPDSATYPYAGKYNENHCPAKEPAPARSGRFPACRSYYGVYDLTGNLWEWTSTKSKDNDDFYLVAGGNWNTGNQATCALAKFSFYPNVGYPFVGFRCCEDVKAK